MRTQLNQLTIVGFSICMLAGTVAAQIESTVSNNKSSSDNGGLKVTETESTITVGDSSGVILSYNKTPPPIPADADPVYLRSGFLHPINTPSGHTVTAVYPEDHRHQNGLFSAWVRTRWNGRKIDFWNVAKKTGRVEHRGVEETFETEKSAGFSVTLVHRAVKEPAVDILQERWTVSARRISPIAYSIDLETHQSALTDEPLIIEEYHYGGVALRGLLRWIRTDDSDEFADDSTDDSFRMVNDLGADRIVGNHQKARWVSMIGQIDEHDVSITMLSHPSNLRAPQTARLHPIKPYFCFAPCVEGKFKIDRKHPYRAKYRILVTDTKPTQQWIEKQWQSWAGTAKSVANSTTSDTQQGE